EATGRRRREVLRLLRSSPDPMSIVAIADRLGVHPNTVRFHLDTLVADSQVEQVEQRRKGPGRPPLMLRAVRQMDRGGTRNYRILAEILITALAAERNPRAKAVAAGRAWARELDSGLESLPAGVVGAEEAIDKLVAALDELGFAPERRNSNGEQQVGLRHCPFLELAETGASVVCPMHLGLMQGALETWAAPVSVDRLDVFVEPDLCLAHITPVGAAG
ncbi:MAG TPA: helix-turn-helix domain-containing protein, partial [Mycobacterium sp.]|nr:helix-turn-helix domain-containing protein [Mycobacterium sp.]